MARWAPYGGRRTLMSSALTWRFLSGSSSADLDNHVLLVSMASATSSSFVFESPTGAAMVLGDSHGAHSALASTPAARRRCPRQQLADSGQRMLTG